MSNFIINNSSGYSFALVDADGKLISTGQYPQFDSLNLEPGEFLAGDGVSSLQTLDSEQYGGEDAFVVIWAQDADFTGEDFPDPVLDLVSTASIMAPSYMSFTDTNGDGIVDENDDPTITLDNAAIEAIIDANQPDAPDEPDEPSADGPWWRLESVPQENEPASFTLTGKYVSDYYVTSDPTSILLETNFENGMPQSSYEIDVDTDIDDPGNDITFEIPAGILVRMSVIDGYNDGGVIVRFTNAHKLTTEGEALGDVFLGSGYSYYGMDLSGPWAPRQGSTPHQDDPIAVLVELAESGDSSDLVYWWQDADTVLEGDEDYLAGQSLINPVTNARHASLLPDLGMEVPPQWEGLDSLTFVNTLHPDYDGIPTGPTEYYSDCRFILAVGDAVNVSGLDQIQAVAGELNYTITSVKLAYYDITAQQAVDISDELLEGGTAPMVVDIGTSEVSVEFNNGWIHQQCFIMVEAEGPSGMTYSDYQFVGLLTPAGPDADPTRYMKLSSVTQSIYHEGINLGRIGANNSSNNPLTDHWDGDADSYQAHWLRLGSTSTEAPKVLYAESRDFDPDDFDFDPDLLTIVNPAVNNYSDTPDVDGWGHLVTNIEYVLYPTPQNGTVAVLMIEMSDVDAAQRWIYGPDWTNNSAHQISLQYNASGQEGHPTGRKFRLLITSDLDGDWDNNNDDQDQLDDSNPSASGAFPTKWLDGDLSVYDYSAGEMVWDISFHYKGVEATEYPGEAQDHDYYGLPLAPRLQVEGSDYYTDGPWTIGVEQEYIKYFYDKKQGQDFPEDFDENRLGIVLDGGSFELVPYGDNNFEVGKTELLVSEGLYEGSSRYWIRFKVRCVQDGRDAQVCPLYITYTRTNDTVLIDSQKLYVLSPQGALTPSGGFVMPDNLHTVSPAWIINAIPDDLMPAGAETRVMPPDHRYFEGDILGGTTDGWGLPNQAGSALNLTVETYDGQSGVHVFVNPQFRLGPVIRDLINTEISTFHTSTGFYPSGYTSDAEDYDVYSRVVEQIKRVFNLGEYSNPGESYQRQSLNLQFGLGLMPDDLEDMNDFRTYGASSASTMPSLDLWPLYMLDESGEWNVDNLDMHFEIPGQEDSGQGVNINALIDSYNSTDGTIDWSIPIVVPSRRFTIESEHGLSGQNPDEGQAQVYLMAMSSPALVYGELDWHPSPETIMLGEPFETAVQVGSVDLPIVGSGWDLSVDPPDNQGQPPLFIVELLDHSANGYAGTPAVPGNDMQISSAGDLLVAVDLQLGFSELGQEAIHDIVAGHYVDNYGQLIHANDFSAGAREIIDAFISEGSNLDLWFGLGETTDELAAYSGDFSAHNDALVRYGQSDGFNASPPPQSIWPNGGAEFIDIGGLLTNLVNFYLVAPALLDENGNKSWYVTPDYDGLEALIADPEAPDEVIQAKRDELQANFSDQRTAADWGFADDAAISADGGYRNVLDFAQLDFSGKIALPQLTYEIDPEPNTPTSGDANVWFVAARSQNGAYGIYDVAAGEYSQNNPQYAAVDVQSVSFPLSNNNEDNDPQQGENNMSYNIIHTLLAEGEGTQSHGFSMVVDAALIADAVAVEFDWMDNPTPDNREIPGVYDLINAAAPGDEVSWQLDFNFAENKFYPIVEGIFEGATGFDLPAWSGSMDPDNPEQPVIAGMIVDILGQDNVEIHSQTFSEGEGDGQGDGESTPPVDGGDDPVPPSDIAVLDSENCPSLRGPRARQLRFDKFDAAGTGFSINVDGSETLTLDQHAVTANGMSSAEASGSESHIVSLQTHMEDQDELLHKLGVMINGGSALSSASNDFDNRSSIVAMIEENRSDQNDMQTALSLADGDTAFADFNKEVSPTYLAQEDIDALAPAGVSDSDLDQDAEYGALKRYDDGGDLPADLAGFQGMDNDTARKEALDIVHGNLNVGDVMRNADGSDYHASISGSHFDSSETLEDIARKLDGGLIDADVDISEIRNVLGVSDTDTTLTLANPSGTVLDGTSLTVVEAVENLDSGIIASNSRILDIENWQSSGLRWRTSKATKQELALEMIARQESGDQKENEAHYVRSEDKIFVHVASAGTQNDAGESYDFKPSSDWDEDSSLSFALTSASSPDLVLSLELKDLRGASGESLELEILTAQDDEGMEIIEVVDGTNKLQIKTMGPGLLPSTLEALAGAADGFAAAYSAVDTNGDPASVPSDSVFDIVVAGTLPGGAYRYEIDGFQSDGTTEFAGGFIVTMDYSHAMDTFSGHSSRIGTLESEMDTAEGRLDEVEHDISDIAGALGLTLEDIADGGTVAFSFDAITGGTSAGFLGNATTAEDALNALNAEAAEASDERDNIAAILGMDDLADPYIMSDAGDNLVFTASSVIDALNKLHVWRTSELQYKPAVADKTALDVAIVVDETREIGDTYWVTGEKTRYTIMGFDMYETDGTTPQGNHSLVVSEGADVPAEAEIPAVPASTNQAVIDGMSWTAAELAGHVTEVQLADYVAAGGSADDVVEEGALQPYVSPVAPVPAADRLVNVSVTQSEEMDDADMQEAQDALELEVYKLKTGYQGLKFKMVRLNQSETDLYDFVTRDTSLGGLGLADVGHAEILVNGVLAGFITRDSHDASNQSIIPCGPVVMAYPGDDITVKHSEEMDLSTGGLESQLGS